MDDWEKGSYGLLSTTFLWGFQINSTTGALLQSNLYLHARTHTSIFRFNLKCRHANNDINGLVICFEKSAFKKDYSDQLYVVCSCTSNRTILDVDTEILNIRQLNSANT